MIEGSTVDADYIFVAWSSGGDRVFLSGGSDERQHLHYQLEEPRAVRLRVDVGAFYGMAAQ